MGVDRMIVVWRGLCNAWVCNLNPATSSFLRTFLFYIRMNERHIRIHGDNIVECERTLNMIVEAFNASCVLLKHPVYFPKYRVETGSCAFEIELLSGHGRWGGIDLGNIVSQHGGRLRESADSYITEIQDGEEQVLLAIEYCSALPAGNNAWQRNGRALASVMANVPYLYYAEIGGIELDENRTPKAPRYPNPAVPFSYITLSKDMGRVCLPVYRAHPSMTEENMKLYKDTLGYADGLRYLKGILLGEDTSEIVASLANKALALVKILSDTRQRRDTLRGNEWKLLLNSRNRVSRLARYDGIEWKKKSASKVAVTDTFDLLKEEVESLSAKPITAKDLPFCIIPKANVSTLKSWLKKTYRRMNPAVDTKKDLAIVWITGFKPRGDDSRPDRGLAPLCRMLLGRDANIMAVVSGPGTKYTWDLLTKSPDELCNSNGLFQAIFVCCNYLLVDSTTCNKKMFISIKESVLPREDLITFPYIEKPVVSYFEHDTDCAIHQIFAHHEADGIYECFCNPPGGDWSGISFYRGNEEYKWTSLPRVSEASKRPDHIFQFSHEAKPLFITIESKGLGRDLEDNIGNRLKDYIKDLFQSEPTAYRTSENTKWRFFDGTLGKVGYGLLAVGAFLYKNDEELSQHLDRGNLDAIFAFEFGEVSTLHFYSNERGALIGDHLKQIASEQGTFIVKIH